jgi:hypothetical protein
MKTSLTSAALLPPYSFCVLVQAPTNVWLVPRLRGLLVTVYPIDTL